MPVVNTFPLQSRRASQRAVEVRRDLHGRNRRCLGRQDLRDSSSNVEHY
jgi:hypothetical protein